MGKIVIERELAAAFRKGERGAVGEVYRRTYKFLYLLAAGLLKSPDDAFDAVHDVFARVIDRGIAMKNGSRLVSYLASAVRRRAYDFLSARKRIESDAEVENLPSFDSGNPYFASLCPGLSQKETAVLLLHLSFGFSFREIAELTSLPRSSLHDVYASALTKARKNIGDIGDETQS